MLAGSFGVEVKECCPGISQYCQRLSDFKRPPEVATGERALWVVLDPGQYGYLMRGSLHWEPATRTESSAQHSVMTSMVGMGAGRQGGPRERIYVYKELVQLTEQRKLTQHCKAIIFQLKREKRSLRQPTGFLRN